MIKRWLLWLFYEPRHVWIALLPTAVSLVYALGYARTENAIRLTGLTLQLLGILTVVWGLVATWRFFGLGDPIAKMLDWLSRVPWRRGVIHASMNESVKLSDAFAARGHTSWPIDPSAPIPDRLVAIERNLPLIQERISQTQQELDHSVRELRAEVKHAIAAASEQTARVESKVSDLGTGSLHISAMGALWLFVGSILGSASSNLEALLK